MNKLHTLSFGNATIEYTLNTGAASSKIRIAVHRDGRCIVTMPRTMSRFNGIRFINEKARWIFEKKKLFEQRKSIQIVANDKETYQKYRQQALKIILEKIEKFNAIYKFSFAHIHIRNQKSRWGSCSRRRNLNFNMKIALIPETLVEYIVVHELCHLQELNHSRAFWELVSRTIPNYAVRRRELKQFCIGV